MKAMLFAAGLGTRLGDFTKSHPKALAEVGGIPMLGRVILKLKDAGVRDFVVNVHHFADQIDDYLAANNHFGVDIHISDERDLLLDTGGGLLKAKNFLAGDEPIIVHNADILTDFDIPTMERHHLDSGASSTLLAARRDTSRYLLFDNSLRMVGWKNIKSGEIRTPWDLSVTDGAQALAFGGVHIISPTTLNALEAYATEAVFSITSFYIDKCRDYRFEAYLPEEDYRWLDIGKPESLSKAQSIVSELRPTSRQE